MQLLLPPVSRKTHSEFTKVISLPVKPAANLKTLLRTLDKVMNELRQRAKGQDCTRAECCFNEEGSSDRPSKIRGCLSELWWRHSLLLPQLNRCMNIFAFVSANWFHWKKKSLKMFNDGGSPQQTPSEGGREGGAAAASLGLQRNTSGSCIAAQITRTCLMADYRHTHAVWGSSTLGFPCRLMYLMYIWLF